MEFFMKNFYLVFVSMLFVSNASALQLVCKGKQLNNYQLRDQRIVYMDCSNKTAVVDMLGAAWNEQRKQRLSGNASIDRWSEETCWKMYKDAKDSPPHFSVDMLVTHYVTQCNIALLNVK